MDRVIFGCQIIKVKMEQRKIEWTLEEKLRLENSYFKILRVTEEYYELQSKNTGHLWIIKKQYNNDCLIMLYHKHSQQVSYYHKQCAMYTVKQAIKVIQRHDKWLMRLKS